MKFAFGLLLVLGLTLLSVAHARSTPDYWNCENRVSGAMEFGRVGNGCDVATFLDPQQVRDEYGDFVYEDGAADRSKERARYLSVVFAFMRDGAIYYLKSRRPDVATEEQQAFINAIYAVAYQESLWSHYRLPTGTVEAQLKMLRGDSGHGHGMMQVDDRAHYTEIVEKAGADFATNFFYALDIYYAAWMRAPSAPCLSSERDWVARSRAAYSAYNGGPSRICRWADPNNAWAQNDSNFLTKLSTPRWKAFIENDQVAATVDVACLAEHREHCAKPNPTPLPFPSPSVLYAIESGEFCIYDGRQLECVQQAGDRFCLSKLSDADFSKSTAVTEAQAAGMTRIMVDRHEMCAASHVWSSSVGRVGIAKAAVEVRTQIGGATGGGAGGGNQVATLAKGSLVQVLDFQFGNDVTAMSLLVAYGAKDSRGQVALGWVDARFFDAIEAEPTQRVIPRMGNRIEVVLASGINMRQTPGGTKVGVARPGAGAIVQDIVVRKDDNQIYLKITIRGVTGFIYAGHVKPQLTLSNWVKIL